MVVAILKLYPSKYKIYSVSKINDKLKSLEKQPISRGRQIHLE